MILKQLNFLKNSRFKYIKAYEPSQSSDQVQVFVFGKAGQAKKLLKDSLQDWVLEKIKSKPEYLKADGIKNSVHLVFPKHNNSRSRFDGVGNYALFRDVLGAHLKNWQSEKKVHLIFVDCNPEMVKGAVAGLDIAHYTYKDCVEQNNSTDYQVSILKGTKQHAASVDQGQLLASSVNMARHLVNSPPNMLYPETYAKAAKGLFSSLKNTTVTVWDDKKLIKENMNLLSAVGQASVNKPRMVHIKYRPNTKKPVAFVGKGVTFDSGGINLKPGQYMRLMKKDMGGSASVFGVAHQLIASGCKQPFDFYLGLVENSVAENAFRPSDVLIARNGMSVEIDNTDAEGRLVMADILALVSEAKGKDRPSLVVDMATLTGASRVALGLEVGGMFSDEDALAAKMQKLSLKVGDPVWHMPLVPGCATGLRSEFAETQNSTSGHGGAIRAAMFLKKFVAEDIPWLHFDINGWITSPKGALQKVGGNGQLVQLFAEHYS